MFKEVHVYLARCLGEGDIEECDDSFYCFPLLLVSEQDDCI